MFKKLEANGLWETSRMILPEHKETTQNQAKQTDRLERPHLDEQELDTISTVLFQSHRHQSDTKTVKVRFENRKEEQKYTKCIVSGKTLAQVRPDITGYFSDKKEKAIGQRLGCPIAYLLIDFFANFSRITELG